LANAQAATVKYLTRAVSLENGIVADDGAGVAVYCRELF
jgi:hypothetical protein